jgi:hypothetical protein
MLILSKNACRRQAGQQYRVASDEFTSIVFTPSDSGRAAKLQKAVLRQELRPRLELLPLQAQLFEWSKAAFGHRFLPAPHPGEKSSERGRVGPHGPPDGPRADPAAPTSGAC